MRTGHAILFAVVLGVFGCAQDRSAGNSLETDNVLTARTLPVDSILPSWNRDSTRATVATLRLDASNFDFSRSNADGSDLSVESDDGLLLPFRVVFWDSLASRGRIETRLKASLQGKGRAIVLRWGLPRGDRQDSTLVWSGLPDSQIAALTSVMVDDFESGALRNRLPDSANWAIDPSASASVASFGIASSPDGRTGHALHVTFTADSSAGRYVIAKTALATSPRCVRSLDSVVLWVRGPGNFGVALERLTDSGWVKAWWHGGLDSGWQRLRIRPQDMDPSTDSYGSVGWAAIRDSLTHLTLSFNGGTTQAEMWIDDIRIHGIGLDDLR